MSADDIEYLKNYLPQTLYVHPGREGSYATLVAEDETMLAEIDVTLRSKLAVSAFYVNEKKDFGSFKITKLKYHKTYGWQEDGCVQVNNFHLSHMREFVNVLMTLNLGDAAKTRIALGNVQIETLKTLLTSSQGAALVKDLSEAPELQDDIFAVASKRRALQEFEGYLSRTLSEGEWQAFFERNTWIFGHGLNYIFLEKAAEKLEAVTTGPEFDRPGKRTDALMRTRAEVSQYVLIEIKRNDTGLVQKSTYRPGCWGVSHELSDAVTQIQKTTFEFTRKRFRDRQKDSLGNDSGGEIYSVDPRTYLVVGDLSQIRGNDDKVTCFELYRRNVRAPEILTFDELFQRASCIVENISHAAAEAALIDENDIPF